MEVGKIVDIGERVFLFSGLSVSFLSAVEVKENEELGNGIVDLVGDSFFVC